MNTSLTVMKNIPHALHYGLWLIGQIFLGAFAIAKDVFRPVTAMHPVVIHYPLRVTKDWQITALSTSITMTPGTLSIGLIPPEKKTQEDHQKQPTILLVQAVYGTNPDEVTAGLSDMEERLCPSVKGIDHGAPGQGEGPRSFSYAITHPDQKER